MTLWIRLHISHLRTHGLEVYRGHINRPLVSLPTFKYPCDQEPTLAHVIHDLFTASKKVALTPVHSGVRNFSPNDFLIRLIVLANDPGADPANRMHTPLVAWNIPDSKGGLEQCRIEPPADLFEHDVFVSPICMGTKLPLDYRKRQPLFHTIIKPVECIIDVHDDGPLTANVLVQIVGHTIFFTWPGTESNRRFFEPFHCTQHPFILSRALECMTDLNVTILSPGMGVIMNVDMIYAEMSPETSATEGWVFVKAAWLQTQENQNSCFREVRLIKSLMARPLGMDDDVRSMVGVVEYGVNMWKCLETNMREETPWNEIAEDIELIKTLLDIVKGLFPKITRK